MVLAATPWELILLAILLWVAAYALFFKRDLQKWWKFRRKRRAEARTAARKAAEAHARHLDELASKYPLPGAPQPPSG